MYCRQNQKKKPTNNKLIIIIIIIIICFKLIIMNFFFLIIFKKKKFLKWKEYYCQAIDTDFCLVFQNVFIIIHDLWFFAFFFFPFLIMGRHDLWKIMNFCEIILLGSLNFSNFFFFFLFIVFLVEYLKAKAFKIPDIFLSIQTKDLRHKQTFFHFGKASERNTRNFYYKNERLKAHTYIK